MALDLKKLASRRSAEPAAEDASSGSARKAAPKGNPEWHGRDAPPPSPGSGWDAFLDWASGEAFDAWPEDVALAFRLWSGNSRDEDPPAPKGP